MHVLIPFDIVPVESRVPQSAFGFAPVSKNAVKYALDVYGTDGDLRITAAQLSTDTISLEENIGAAKIRSLADEMNVSVTVEIHSMQNVDSQAAIRDEIAKIVEREDIDTVVMGYGEDPFAEAEFQRSTAHAVLQNHDTPVVLVP